MGDFNLREDIQSALRISELSSVTLSYYVNGFAKAMNMNLSGGSYEDIYNRGRYNFARKESGDGSYSISIRKIQFDTEKCCSQLQICGMYYGFNIDYSVLYNERINKDRILELPFSISITSHDEKYSFMAERQKGQRQKGRGVTIALRGEAENGPCQFGFYVKISDFSIILEAIHSFVSSPASFFGQYYNIVADGSEVFSNRRLRIALGNGETLQNQ